jgi:hypothetical protein
VPSDQLIDRLHAHVRECGRRYPEAWRQIDAARAQRGQIGIWADWCFCPMAASYAIVSAKHGDRASTPLEFARALSAYSPPDLVSRSYPGDIVCGLPGETPLHVSRLSALSAWRVSQGIYQIDPTVRLAVMETPMDGDIPVDVLKSLPEWCIYIPTPGYHVEKREVLGFFAHLEHDANDGRAELRMLYDFADMGPFDGLSPEIVHLHRGMGLEASYQEMLKEMRRQYAKLNGRISPEYESASQLVMATARERLVPIISLLLYVCSQTAEYRLGGERTNSRPSYAKETKTKKGWRLFPPDRPKIWYVGERLGRAIRTAESAGRHDGDERAGPRPHVRRAHWHSFWTGPKTAARKIVLKWLPPIPVAMEEDTAEARMRHAKLKPVKNLDREINAVTTQLEGRNDSPHESRPAADSGPAA